MKQLRTQRRSVQTVNVYPVRTVTLRTNCEVDLLAAAARTVAGARASKAVTTRPLESREQDSQR